MIRFRARGLAAAAAAVVMMSAALFSCRKESEKSLYAAQEKNIENVINSVLSQNPDFTVVNKDYCRKVILANGEGDGLTEGRKLVYRYIGYVVNGGSLSAQNFFYTNIPEIAAQYGWAVSDSAAVFRPDTLAFDKSKLIKGLADGLEGIKEGEQCLILFTGEYGYGSRKNGQIPANSALAYQFTAEKIINE